MIGWWGERGRGRGNELAGDGLEFEEGGGEDRGVNNKLDINVVYHVMSRKSGNFFLVRNLKIGWKKRCLLVVVPHL